MGETPEAGLPPRRHRSRRSLGSLHAPKAADRRCPCRFQLRGRRVDHMGGQRALIIATSETPADVDHEIEQGTHYRIDYLELSARLKARYIDYQTVGGGRVARAIEDRLRLDLREAVHAARLVRRQRYEVVMCMSERVG